MVVTGTSCLLPLSLPTVSTEGRDYAERLHAKQNARWKKALDVQRPYRRNLQRQQLGRTLDVGCGIGRQLGWLAPGSVGVDHNAHSVAVAREAGHTAYTVEEFLASEHAQPGAFDAMVLSHVVEHMPWDQGIEVVRTYLPFIQPGGRVMFIVPQEVGFKSDETHVLFFDGDDLVRFAHELGLEPGRPWSFPFPRATGKAFIYNETNLIARIPPA
ncbi:MAG: class I SAM-dependent methyltransferase [Dermatophilaceae bacterium]|nr:class I SAM-dependent methyltransferase [Dermatophilaceae bacterium]MBP9918575.1 class I SAM-dependent methyltransferase [Dermatophilaceae bacterium]